MKKILDIVDISVTVSIIVDMSTIGGCMDRRVGKRIHYLANQNRAYVNSLLKEEGLTHGECNVIIEIYRNNGLSQEGLGKILKVDKSAITRIVKTMIEKGYITKQVNEHDRRSHCLFLTDKSNEKIDLIFNTFKQSSAWLLEELSTEEIETVITILDKMCSTVRKKVDKYE